MSIAGTTWTGSSPESGEYTMVFLKEGQLQYILNVMQNGVTAPRTIKGTWKQSGNKSFTGVDGSQPNTGKFAAFFGPVGSLGLIAQNVATYQARS